jgi:hypothetical protein
MFDWLSKCFLILKMQFADDSRIKIFVKSGLMSLADKSQIFNAFKMQAGTEAFSTVHSTSKRKGLSLSKQLNSKPEERSQSYIKLSARTKNQAYVEKREIKLIVKPKSEH